MTNTPLTPTSLSLDERRLKDLGACKSGVDFCERNNLIGRTIVAHYGDILGYLMWLLQRSDHELHYDEHDRLIERVENKYVTKYTYSEGAQHDPRQAPLLSVVEMHLGDVITATFYTYDAHGRCVLEKQADGTTVSYGYDNRGNRILEATNYPDGDTSTQIYEYDDNGNVVKDFRPSGSRVVWDRRYECDEHGNVVKTWRVRHDFDPPRPALPTTHEYAETNGKQLVTKTTAPDFTRTTEYDERGNEVKTITPQGVYLREYDEADNVIKITYPDGDTHTISYMWADEDNFQIIQNDRVICHVQLAPIDRNAH